MNGFYRIRAGLYFQILAATVAMVLGVCPAASQIRLLQQSAQTLVFSCHLDTLMLEPLSTDGQSRTRIPMPQGDWIPSGAFAVPVHVLPLHIPADDVVLHIEPAQSEQIRLHAPLFRVQEMSLSGQEIVEPAESLPVNGPVDIQRIGRLNGLEVWQLRFAPVQVDSGGRNLTVFRNLRVTVSWRKPAGDPALRQVIDSRTRQTAEAMGVVLSEPLIRSLPPVQNQQTLASPAGSRWKIHIDEDGWYRITGRDLQNAGIDLLQIDVKTLQLTLGAAQVPIYVTGWQNGQFDEEDSFEFLGETARYTDQQNSPDLVQDPYGPTQVYILSWGQSPGIWMVDEPAAVLSGSNPNIRRPYSFMQTVHIERNAVFNHLSDVPEGVQRDHFFIDGGIAAAEKRDYQFDLWDPDSRSAAPLALRIMMSGRSTPSASVDPFFHRVSTYINNRYVLEDEWFGQDYRDMRTAAQTALTSADLRSGQNSLTLINLIDASKIDYVMLNWFEVNYPRLYRAHDNQLRFSIPPDYKPGTFLFQIDGFTSKQIDVFKLGTSRLVGGTLAQTTDIENYASLQLSFQDQVTSYATEYFAIARDRKKKPARILADIPSRLTAPDLASDYVVIAHKRFIESEGLDELLRHRQDQGLRVLKVDVEDIFDEFGNGRPTPEAIKAFLRTAYRSWQNPRLKYVLLVGNGSRTRQTAAGDTLDLVPVYLRQTYKWGATASDYWYTLLDGDDELSDIALGRLPVRSLEECDVLTRKIVAYEKSAVSGTWRNRLLFIGGNFNSQAPFDQQALDLIGRISPAFEKNILLTAPRSSVQDDPLFGSTVDLLDYFDQGCSIINFHGHGGGGIWADNGLLRTEDIARLSNQGKLPFIMSMTCFSGAFESPSFRGLADALLFNENNGSVAFLGASGEGWVLNDYLLQREILQVFDQSPSLPLGEVIRLGKNLYQIKNGLSAYVFAETNQYHLLGDPALCLGVAQKEMQVQTDRQLLSRGESLSVTARLPFSSGLAYATIVDSVQISHGWESHPVVAGVSSFQSIVPAEFAGSKGRLLVYAEDDLGLERLHGAATISFADALFDSIRVEGASGDSNRVAARIIADEPILNAWCRVQQDSLSLFSDSFGTFRSLPFYYPYGFSYRFYARLSDGRVFVGDEMQYTPTDHIDLAVIGESIRLTGQTETRLAVRVSNNSPVNLAEVTVQFDAFSQVSGDWKSIGRNKIAINSLAKAETQIAFSPLPGQARVRIHVDPDSVHDRLYRYDNIYIAGLNVDRFTLTPQSGLLAGDSVLAELAVDSTFFAILPAGCVLQSTVVQVQTVGVPGIEEQPDLLVVPGVAAYRLKLADSLAVFSQGVQVSFRLPAGTWTWLAQSEKPVHVFQLEPRSGKWVRRSSHVQDDRVIASIDGPGTLAVLAGEDHLPPTIEVTVDGQPPVDQAFVQRNPRIGVLIQDLNGVDISDASLKFLLDGQAVASDQLLLPDTLTNGNLVLVELQPELTPALHTLQLAASDCYGNASLQSELSFQVANRFDLRLLGTYPNPFVRETVFAYELTQPCDRLEVKIYTASGQLIRTLDARSNSADANPFGADYHELLWDGRDKDGDSVANGVYFFKVSARAGEQSRELTGKLMRLQ